MADSHWSLDKRIPIAIIFAFITQTVGAIWFFSELSFNVTNNKQKISNLETTQAELSTKVSDLKLEIQKTNIHLQYTNSYLSDIRNFLKNEVEWTTDMKKKK